MKKTWISIVLFALICALCFAATACGGNEETGPRTDLAITVAGETENGLQFDYDGSEKTVVLENVPAGVTPTVEYSNADGVLPADAPKPVNAGEYTAKITVAQTKQYNAFEKTVSIVISKVKNTLAIEVADIVVGGTVNPVVTKNVGGGAVTYTYKGKFSTVYEESATPPTAVGCYTVTAVSAATQNYKSAKKSADFRISASEDPLDGVPDLMKRRVESLSRLDLPLAPSSWYTNGDTSAGQDFEFWSAFGVVYSKNRWITYLGNDVPLKIYLLAKFDEVPDSYIRAMWVAGEDATATANFLDKRDAYCKYSVEVERFEQGWSLIEMEGARWGGTVSDDAPITGLVILAGDNFKKGFELHGIYVDPVGA